MKNLSKIISIKKTISWRIISIFSTGIIVFIFTGKIIEATIITLIDALVSTILYYFHERFWFKKSN